MTPKEKALQLYTDFHIYEWDEEVGYLPNEEESKKMASKCVKEIIEALPGISCKFEIDNYWKEVKVEIEKL